MVDYAVKPTSNRSDSGGEYIVRMSWLAAHREFGWRRPRLVAISYRHPAIDNVEVTATALLIVGLKDRSLDGDLCVEVDQTLRQALGIDYLDYAGAKVTVHRLHGVGRVKRVVARLVGRRLVYCRPAVLKPLDIEKNIVRLPNEVLGLVGIKSGDRVELAGIEKTEQGEYWMRTRSVAAIEASQGYIDRYVGSADGLEPADAEPAPGRYRRYPNIGRIIGQEDIFPIYIDLEIRLALFGPERAQKFRGANDATAAAHQFYLRTVQCAQPILVHRAPLWAIANEVIGIGLTGSVITFALGQLLPGTLTTGKFTGALAIGAVAALFFAVVKTRSAVR